MDDLIKIIQEMLAKKPVPKSGIADTAAGVDFIGKRLSKEQIGDFTIIGSKLTDASRFEPFGIANIGKNKRYNYMKEYSEDLQNNFEKTLKFIKDNPDIRLTQGQKDNILYNLGVLRRTKAEKDKLEKSIYGEGKKSENIVDMEGKALDETKPIIGGKQVDETPAKAGEVLDLPQWAQKSLDRLNELKKYYSKNPPNNKDTLDLYNKQIVQREKALRYTLESGGDEAMFEKLRIGPKTKIPEVFETNKYIDLLPTDQEKTMRNVNMQFGFDFVEDTPVSKKPAKADGDKRLLTDEELEYYEEELGDSERWMNDGTIGEAKKALKDYKEYEADMLKEYNAEKLQEASAKAGEGKFTKAQVLVERLKNTIKENPNDEYVQQNFPNFIKEIEAKPELADDANVQEAFGLTDLSETTDQRLVEYPDGTLDFYTKGTDLQGGMESVQSLIDELGISQEEAFRIKQLEPEDQILEITKLRTLKNKPEKAQGGIISARKGFRGGGMDAGAGSDFGGFSQGDNSPAAGGTTGGTTGGNTGGQGDGPSTPQEINVGNAPQVFDINTVGDPSFNPGSINVSGGNNYTPSFDSKNSFLETLLAKGRNVLSKGRQVYDNPFVRLGLATLLPTNFKDVQTAISALDLGKKAFDNRVEIKDFITNDPLSNIQNLLSQKAINDELNRETTIDGQIQGLNIKDMYKKGGIVGLHI